MDVDSGLGDRFEFEEEPKQSFSPRSAEIAKNASLFGKQLFTPEQVESVRKPLIQKVGVPAAEFVSSKLGFLGDLTSVVHSLTAGPLTQMITGQETPYEENYISKLLPTSEMLHKGFEELSGEKLRPETPFEELLATGAGFGGSLGAGGWLKKGRVLGKDIPALQRNLIASIVPASVLVGAKHADLPPWAQAATTVTSSLLTHKLTNKSFKEIAGDLYKKSDQIAQGIMMPSGPLANRLQDFSTKLSEGLTTGPKGRMRNVVNEIEGKIGGGAYRLKDLIKWRQDVNEVSKEFTKAQLKGSENEWRGLRNLIDQTIGDYEKTNPEFSQVYRQANSLYRGLNETKSVENWIKSHKALSGLGIGAELFLGAFTHTLGGVIPAATATKMTEMIAALVRNKGLRKAYADTFKNAAKQDVRATASSLNRMNKQLEKEGIEEEDKERFVFED